MAAISAEPASCLSRPRNIGKGVTPPPNEAQIDHVDPKSEGGPNSNANRKCEAPQITDGRATRSDHDADEVQAPAEDVQ